MEDLGREKKRIERIRKGNVYATEKNVALITGILNLRFYKELSLLFQWKHMSIPQISGLEHFIRINPIRVHKDDMYEDVSGVYRHVMKTWGGVSLDFLDELVKNISITSFDMDETFHKNIYRIMMGAFN